MPKCDSSYIGSISLFLAVTLKVSMLNCACARHSAESVQGRYQEIALNLAVLVSEHTLSGMEICEYVLEFRRQVLEYEVECAGTRSSYEEYNICNW